MLPEKAVFTRRDVEKILESSASKVFDLLSRREIQGYKIGNRWRVSRDELERFVKEGPIK